ncbi:MAG: ribonuclease HI family protein [Candidatus Dadabacteria bacterium]|nr:MAG: ribonuclease HI family protein [Candidatus Dadabacteria bacterium]
MKNSKIYIHADGGSRGNPGPAAIGIIVFDENMNQIDSFKECIGDKTSNEAEYLALNKALKIGMKHTRNEVNILMDSELVIKQMNKRYRVKAANLRPLFLEVKQLELEFQKVQYNHVSRNNSYQSQADKLVNEALDSL